MSWQLFLIIYLILSTAAELLRRKLGKSLPQYNRLINAVSFIGTHLPVGIIAAHIIGYNLAIGWVSAGALALGTFIFPLGSMLGFRASKNVDAGLFGVLEIITPVLTILLAILLLNESLTLQQFIGVGIILFSTLLIAIPSYEHSNKRTRTSILIALLVTFIVAVQTIYETWILGRIGLGTYLLLGWGMQAFWMGVFAWPQRHKLRQIATRKRGVPIGALAIIKSTKGFAFLAALSASGSAALVSSFVSFLPILIVIASYIVLKERKMIKLRILAAVIGSAGLFILST